MEYYKAINLKSGLKKIREHFNRVKNKFNMREIKQNIKKIKQFEEMMLLIGEL